MAPEHLAVREAGFGGSFVVTAKRAKERFLSISV
jgi:hypothetical protein